MNYAQHPATLLLRSLGSFFRRSTSLIHHVADDRILLLSLLLATTNMSTIRTTGHRYPVGVRISETIAISSTTWNCCIFSSNRAQNVFGELEVAELWSVVSMLMRMY